MSRPKEQSIKYSFNHKSKIKIDTPFAKCHWDWKNIFVYFGIHWLNMSNGQYMHITCIYHTVLLLALPFITVLSQIFYMSVCFLFGFSFLEESLSSFLSYLIYLYMSLLHCVFFSSCWLMSSHSSFYPTNTNFTRTKNYYLILHVHFFSWWQSGHIPVSILLILHAFFYSYLFLAFLFLLTYVVTIQLLPALDLFTQEVLFLAATFTTDWHLFLTYPNVGTFPRMAHSTTRMATRHLQS